MLEDVYPDFIDTEPFYRQVVKVHGFVTTGDLGRVFDRLLRRRKATGSPKDKRWRATGPRKEQ